MNEPLKKLIKARDDLLDKCPLFGALMTLKYVEDINIPTAAVDGVHFFYNPEFIMKYNNLQLQGLCFHEHDHVAMLHFDRKNGRNHTKWNMATDYVINLKWVDLLGDNSWIEGGLLDEKYRDMSSEEVYKLLPDPDPNDDGSWNIGGVQAPVDGKGNPVSSGQEEDIKKRVKQSIDKAIKVHKAMSSGSAGRGEFGGLAREYQSVVTPPLTYEDQLHILMKAEAETDWSYRKADRSRAHEDIVFPSLCNEETAPPTIAVDTSGSISADEITAFISNTFSVLETFGFERLDVIYCDYKVQRRETLSIGDTANPRGGGGTRFSPVMELIAEQEDKPKGLIYYTDGECEDFGEDPCVPVLWVITTNIIFEPPFGEVAYL